MTNTEYNKLLKYLYFEGYADSYEEADYILEDMSNIERKQLMMEAGIYEGYKKLPKGRMDVRATKNLGKAAVAGGLSAAILAANDYAYDGYRDANTDKTVDALGRMAGKPLKRAAKIIKARITHSPKASQKKAEENAARGREKRKSQNEAYELLLDYLIDEGYTNTVDGALTIIENMSDDWIESIMEGMTMKDFKANRKKLQRKEKSADARKRGHVGKTWLDTGKTYTPDEAKSSRAKMTDARRQALYRIANNPDDDSPNDDHYPASKTNNPKKLRKQKAMGEHD